jgi:hypothetical protein
LGADANLLHLIEPATPAMSDPTVLPFAFPSVQGKKLTAAFDGGRLTSDGGILLLAQAARRLRIADKLAAVIPDRRDPRRGRAPAPRDPAGAYPGDCLRV